ncbi:Acetyltransferase (GNAT) family protein [Streptomyces aidingensis]|uniref:Acetyltransferase (GNAT) family protein n=1 Tax=Streptomyces aidingensis TaxID=910347 RepID=A0A1I1T5M6_9ACTN|nr:Acetyltransferase (GNAT) family protein [Streptomyces aidingensis]
MPYVVTEHLAHFGEGFFARLGPRFLAAYTVRHLDSPYARCLVAERDGERAGFLIGLTDPAGHRRHLVQRHGRALALRGTAALLVRPALAVHFTRTRAVRYAGEFLTRHRPAAGESRAAARPQPGRRVAVLAYLVVSGTARSQGLGTALVERFLREAAEAGCDRADLVTAAGAGGAGRFYRRLGWRFTGNVGTTDGRNLSMYSHPLSGN